jgi:hypothetical protein
VCGLDPAESCYKRNGKTSGSIKDEQYFDRPSDSYFIEELIAITTVTVATRSYLVSYNNEDGCLVARCAAHSGRILPNYQR